MKKSDIAFICNSFYPQEGGIQTYFLHLAKENKTYRSNVFTVKKGSEKSFEQIPFNVFRDDDIRTPYVVGLIYLLKLFLTTGFDLKLFIAIISNRNWVVKNTNRIKSILTSIKHHNLSLKYIIAATVFHNGTIGLILKSIFNVPLVTLTHGAELLINDERHNTGKLQAYTLKYSDLVVANSDFTRDLSIKKGASETKTVVNLLGADTGRFFPTNVLKENFGYSENDILMLTLSHLVKRKGHDMVIKSMPSLVKKYPNLKYIIIGRGPEERNLKNLTNELGLADYVNFHGYCEDDKLNLFLNLMDIFIMPSRAEGNDVEGFGIVFLEANACRKPVIGGNTGGIPSAIIDGETGFLCDPYSVEIISEKIEQLVIDKEKRESFGLNGFNRVVSNLNWENVAKKFYEILEGV